MKAALADWSIRGDGTVFGVVIQCGEDCDWSIGTRIITSQVVSMQAIGENEYGVKGYTVITSSGSVYRLSVWNVIDN